MHSSPTAFNQPSNASTLPGKTLIGFQNARIAHTFDTTAYAAYDDAYVIWPDAYSTKSQLFKLGGYEEGAIEYNVHTKTPYTYGEQVSQNLLNWNAAEFRGPVLLIDSEYA